MQQLIGVRQLVSDKTMPSSGQYNQVYKTFTKIITIQQKFTQVKSVANFQDDLFIEFLFICHYFSVPKFL